MLKNLFKTATKVITQKILVNKSNIVDQIHNAFYKEVDALLAEAKIKVSTKTNQQELIDKGARLKKLGFSQAEEVIDASVEERRLSDIKVTNMKKDKLHRAILYFSNKYPQYRFITDESVKNLCKKYGLIYASVEYYTGNVPNENLEYIEAFKIDAADKCATLVKSYRGYDQTELLVPGNTKETQSSSFNEYGAYTGSNNFTEKLRFYPLEIVAPRSDFSSDLSETSAFKFMKSIPEDPIVLQPVYYAGEKYYLIVTAWGQEAGDESIINSMHN